MNMVFKYACMVSEYLQGDCRGLLFPAVLSFSALRSAGPHVILLTSVRGNMLQVFILDALVNYQVQDSKDAEKIVERVLPRLQHVNSAVVLSAAKVGCGGTAPQCPADGAFS